MASRPRPSPSSSASRRPRRRARPRSKAPPPLLPAPGAVKLVVGLGNPGRRYEGTRHNVGWWALDHLADVWRFPPWRHEGDALVTDGQLGDEKVRLVKPQTFMNLSGTALRPYLRRLEWEGLHHLLVLVDEIALPIGTARLRAAGSPGGHNGLKSIEATLGTRDYARLRIGVGPAGGERPPGDLADFVLGEFTADERDVVRTQLPAVTDAVAVWAREGVTRAMNVCNAPPKAAPE
ncbi:MAG TPA: aminoacyl-tRNA hydrolase [Gemmatimonadaceae bacterium]|nr:aminoacyl-tRNA hydrolase [Gemmatimonadaceae bacterium]